VPVQYRRCYLEILSVKLPRAPFLRFEGVAAQLFVLCFLCLTGFVCPTKAWSRIPQTGAKKVTTPPLDPAGFAAELRSLEAKLLGGTSSTDYVNSLLHDLPASWTVETAEGDRYQISSDPLRKLLEHAVRDSAQRRNNLEEASVWAEDAATQAEGFATASAGVSVQSDFRPKLDQILKRREFSPPSPPTPLELLRQRISAWMLRMFQKLFEKIAGHPLGSKLLFWLIIFGVVSWLVTTLIQFWTRRARTVGLATIASVASHRSWQEWFRAAQEAATHGEFRDAIHSLYWVGITRLEALSILTVDHTRTPREQLNLLFRNSGETTPAAATPEQRDRMGRLTSQLERVWYGRRPAGIDDFRECLSYVEDLGCR
jgi:Domain of unknown function (DUF4129)